jgi:hypothetical protein
MYIYIYIYILVAIQEVPNKNPEPNISSASRFATWLNAHRYLLGRASPHVEA